MSDRRSIVEIRRMVGNELNSSGFRMKSAVIRIRIEKVMREREREVEQPRRQRQQQHDQDGEDAEGERDVAVPEIVANERASAVCRSGR